MSTPLPIAERGTSVVGEYLSRRALADLLERVSRTFALSNRMLPRRFRTPMTVAYLLFRVSDYLEDNPILGRGEKARLLHCWEQVLAGDLSSRHLEGALEPLPWSDSEAEVAHRFDQILGKLNDLRPDVGDAIRHHARETTIGMELWQRKGPRVRTEAELDEYMHYVAGIVGLMITEVFSTISISVKARRRRLLPLAREYGLGLQTVNIIRGVRKDWERGWIFVPEEYCREAGISPQQLFSRRKTVEALSVVNRLVEKAECHLRAGLRYVMGLPRSLYRVRVAAMWPLMFAARTLAVSRANPQVLYGESKMGRRDVMSIVRHTTAMGWSNAWVRRYFEELLR